MFAQMTCSLVMSNFTLSELLHHLCMLNTFCSFEVLSALLKKSTATWNAVRLFPSIKAWMQDIAPA